MAIATPFPASRAASPSRPVRRQAATSGPIRLTRRGKAVVTLAGALACIGLLQVTGGIDAAASAVAGGPATSAVVVQPGQTLWAIAKSVAPEADPRATVAVIRELNGLAAGVSPVAGQSLVVPR